MGPAEVMDTGQSKAKHWGRGGVRSRQLGAVVLLVSPLGVELPPVMHLARLGGRGGPGGCGWWVTVVLQPEPNWMVQLWMEGWLVGTELC